MAAANIKVTLPYSIERLCGIVTTPETYSRYKALGSRKISSEHRFIKNKKSASAEKRTATPIFIKPFVKLSPQAAE